jgi:hypothetical protein
MKYAILPESDSRTRGEKSQRIEQWKEVSELDDLSGRSGHVYRSAARTWQGGGRAAASKGFGLGARAGRNNTGAGRTRGQEIPIPSLALGQLVALGEREPLHIPITRVHCGGTDRACATYWEARVHSYCTAMDTKSESSWRVVHHAEVGVEARQDGVGLLAGGGSKWTAATCVGACEHTRGKSFATSHQAMEMACWIG